VEASLLVTHKRCGRPQCRCVQEGPIHEAALLTWKEKKVTHTMYVPVELREEVQTWVDNWKQLRCLIGKMSQAQRAVLLQRKKLSFHVLSVIYLTNRVIIQGYTKYDIICIKENISFLNI